MVHVCGVTTLNATRNDFQRYFKCKDVSVNDCEDLQFPNICSVPPCNDCPAGNNNNMIYCHHIKVEMLLYYSLCELLFPNIPVAIF